jgi:hypothetical protein
MSQGDGRAGRDFFTPTQQRIVDLLKNGQPHKRDEVRRCVDELASLASLKTHLVKLRKRIRPHGYDVICQVLHRAYYYRLIKVTILHWPAGVI